MNDVTIAKCHCCGQEMNPSDHNDRLRTEVAILNNAVKTATQSIAELCDENADLTQQLAAANGRLDALMLEYCPDEMTKEQLDNWAAHQLRADLPEADKEKTK